MPHALPMAQVRRYAGARSIAPHIHAEPVLCVVLSGGFQERTRGRETEHGAGHALFCPAFEEHAQTIAPEGAVKLLLAPTAPAVDCLAAKVRLAEAPFVRGRELIPLSRRLAAELDDPDDFSPLVIEGLATEIAGLFGRDAGDGGREALAWVARARDYIEASAGHGPSLEAIARAVGRHPATLSRAFRRTFRMSVGEFSRRARLDAATRMLAQTRAPISEIALECGFCDQAHLTRTFKAAYGIAPSRYRARF